MKEPKFDTRVTKQAVSDWEEFTLQNKDPSVDYITYPNASSCRVGSCLKVIIDQYTRLEQICPPSTLAIHYLPSEYAPIYQTISDIVFDSGFSKDTGLWKRTIKVSIEIVGWENKTVTSDPVDRPGHYNTGKIEVIDFIEDQKLGFCLGNCIKYIARSGKKDPSKLKEDLMKAKWYLEREIDKLEKERKK